MITAGVARLKEALSYFLARVKKGEEVIVTDRGKPIARLVPISELSSDSKEIAQLIRSGILKPPRGRIKARFLKPSPVKDPEGLVLKSLLQERREGR